jgi:hypothetical protein
MSEEDAINPRKEAIAKALDRFKTVSPMLNVIITGRLMLHGVTRYLDVLSGQP